MKNTLVIIGSPLQAISAVCYLVDNVAFKNRIDILISNEFSSASDLANRFREVEWVRYAEVSHTSYSTSKSVYAQCIQNCLIGSKNRIEQIRKDCGAIGLQRYDELICSCETLLAHDVKCALLKIDAETILIDDGTGSHLGTIYAGLSCADIILNEKCGDLSKSTPLINTFKALVNFITMNKLALNVKALYLFSPRENELKRYKPALTINSLILSNDAKKVLRSLFPLREESVYGDRCHVFLAQPDDANPECLKAEAEAVSNLSTIYPDLIVRKHPRGSLGRFKYIQCMLDDGADSWEMLVGMGVINEESTLFSLASTAMTSPKVLFGIEPNVVFLYKSFITTKEYAQIAEHIARDLYAVYMNKGKIRVPQKVTGPIHFGIN